MRKIISVLLAGALVLVLVGCGGNSVDKLRKDIVGEYGDYLVFTEDGRCWLGDEEKDPFLINRYRILEDKGLEITNENGVANVNKWINKDDVQWEETEGPIWYLDGNKIFTNDTNTEGMVLTKR